MIDKNKIIAIDFDGVIHKYSKGWCDGSIYDEVVEGAIESIMFLNNCGYNIVVFTSREDIEVVSNWLKDNLPMCKIYEVTNKKPIAFVYIDDNSIRFTDWESTLDCLQKLIYNKSKPKQIKKVSKKH